MADETPDPVRDALRTLAAYLRERGHYQAGSPIAKAIARIEASTQAAAPPPYPNVEARYSALLAGLAEMRNMIRYCDDQGASADDTLTAVTARLVALIEAHDGPA